MDLRDGVPFSPPRRPGTSGRPTTVGRWLVPVGVAVLAVALAGRRRRQTGGEAEQAPRKLIEALVEQPTLIDWGATLAAEVGDPELRIGYREHESGRFVDAAGRELVRPEPDDDRSWVPIEHDGQLVAALVVDAGLSPEHRQTAIAGTLLALDHDRLQRELAALSVRAREAGIVERRRVERDLHDGVQQRLTAIRLRLAHVQAGDPVARQATMVQLAREVDRSLEEIRAIVAGRAPDDLVAHGIGAALRSGTAQPVPAVELEIVADGLARHPLEIEQAVYYCCLEAIQNAIRHAGPGIAIRVRLDEGHRGLSFTVDDDGPGFCRGGIAPGQGLANMHERLRSLGGALRVEPRDPCGTRVVGVVPIPGSAAFTPRG